MNQHASVLLAAAFAFVISGCSRADQSVKADGTDPGAAKPGLIDRILNRPQPVTIPEGTTLDVRLDQGLSSNTDSGASFTGTVVSPIVVEGKTVIPRGATAHGRVVEAHEGGHLEGVSRLGLELESLEIEGKSYSLDTNEIRRSGTSHKKRNWIVIGGGTGVGALIGGIAGGGKGAMIGTLAGGAAGTGTAAATGKKSVYLPAETMLRFRLDQPISIQVKG
jgi:hypothetical protein